jgi:hypothetical protein
MGFHYALHFKDDNCCRKEAKLEEGKNQSVQQANCYKRSVTTHHTPMVAGITGMVLEWITLSMAT